MLSIILNSSILAYNHWTPIKTSVYHRFILYSELKLISTSKSSSKRLVFLIYMFLFPFILSNGRISVLHFLNCSLVKVAALVVHTATFKLINPCLSEPIIRLEVSSFWVHKAPINFPSYIFYNFINIHYYYLFICLVTIKYLPYSCYCIFLCIFIFYTYF